MTIHEQHLVKFALEMVKHGNDGRRISNVLRGELTSADRQEIQEMVDENFPQG